MKENMSYRDQKKFIETLKRYENKMDGKEKERFSMLVKRHKDDEDLDKQSMEFLKSIFEKYHVNRDKPNYDHLFKKKEN
jgi:hypothetical protein